MRHRFFKMQGCGNDFLITDGIHGEAPEFKPSEVAFLCDRHFGIGADGLVVLKKSEHADVAWSFYNSDGSVAEMCGNAARCVVRYVSEKYLPGETVSLETMVGVVKGRLLSKEEVEISLLPQKDFEFHHEEHVLDLGTGVFQVYSTNTGVPHAVLEVKSLSGYPIEEVGAKIQSHPIFQPKGTNVTFFERFGGKRIFATTYERGVNAETLACGTGAAAAALVFCELYLETPAIHVGVPGGELQVDFSPVSRVLLLRGKAEYVYDIEIEYLESNFEPRIPYGKRPIKVG
jgi:diaminopimelate epimerase